jgi:hypothetical protein
MNPTQPTLWQVVIKTIVTHTVTYFIFGLLASTLFRYGSLYADTQLNLLMRQLNDPLVMAGPLLQPIRGALFGFVFFLLREIVFNRKRGWLVLWLVLLVIGILGTFGPTPGSLEGMIYTVLPISIQLLGLPEVVLQALAMSVVLYYWVNHPGNKWLTWGMSIVFVIVLILPVLGLLVGPSK